MSLFRKELEEEIKTAIRYFNALEPEKKAMIVSNLLNLSDHDAKELLPLLNAVRNDISNYDKMYIANQLYKMGLDETYSMLFVSNMINQAPTLVYQLKEISKLTDDEFGKKFPAIINDVVIERMNQAKLMEKYKIQPQQLSFIIDITRTLMNQLARSQMSAKKIAEICKEAELSGVKTNVLVTTFNTNLDLWKNMLIFSNTQDAYFSLQHIEQQNDQILRILSAILETLKKFSSGSENKDLYR